jgi:hypothetical protein
VLEAFCIPRSCFIHVHGFQCQCETEVEICFILLCHFWYLDLSTLYCVPDCVVYVFHGQWPVDPRSTVGTCQDAQSIDNRRSSDRVLQFLTT